MSVKVASLAGFCFGVERAVKTVNELVEKGGAKIYTLGKLIHNPTIVGDLEKRGVSVISPDDLPSVYEKTNEKQPCVVLIRAHGVTKQVSDLLASYSERNEFFYVADCTCPHVKKIHNIVSEHSDENSVTLIFGNAKHPEVEGICSYVKGEYHVFSDVNELDLGNLTEKRVTVVSQTTQNLSEWKKSQEILEKVCTNPFIFDTICSVTENRQKEVEILAGECDVMLVIGGRDSSNTNKLFEISRSRQPNTFFIEDADSIPPIKVTAHTKVGIAAGASTPGDIIKEVETRMSEKELAQNTDIMEEDFASMLETSFKTLNTGDTVTGTVLSVDANEVKVDLGAKVTGIISVNDLVDPSAKLTDLYKPGDEVTAVAVRVSDVEGMAVLSRRKIEAAGRWQAIVDAYNEGTVLEGKVTEAVKGGVIIVIGGVKVFVPASQSGLSRDADVSVLVGQVHKVKIIDINEQRKRAVASIRAIQREEKKAREAEFWAEMEVGKKFTGRVKSLTSYGAFVDLGAFDGMVHSTELSWKRIKHPNEVVSVGDTLDVFVKDFDQEKRRISLGYKTEETNPWTLFINQYNVGDVANVKIVSLMPFGAFAEVIPGADGLIHISQIAAGKKIATPAEVLKVGDMVDTKIVEIDEENHKISLSIKALADDAEEVEAEETADEE